MSLQPPVCNCEWSVFMSCQACLVTHRSLAAVNTDKAFSDGGLHQGHWLCLCPSVHDWFYCHESTLSESAWHFILSQIQRFADAVAETKQNDTSCTMSGRWTVLNSLHCCFSYQSNRISSLVHSESKGWARWGVVVLLLIAVLIIRRLQQVLKRKGMYP